VSRRRKAKGRKCRYWQGIHATWVLCAKVDRNNGEGHAQTQRGVKHGAVRQQEAGYNVMTEV